MLWIWLLVLWVFALLKNEASFSQQDQSSIVMNSIHGVLVSTIQTPLSPSVIERFKYDILDRLEHEKINYIFFDFSGLTIMDIVEFKAIENIISMAKMMGSDSVLVGLNPGIVASLVLYDIDTQALNTALDVDDAFTRLNLRVD